jgi:hypothetical protein
MATIIDQTPDAAAVTAPFKVDVHRGEFRGDVSKEWFSRPHDERFLSLSDLRTHLRNRWEHSADQTMQNRDVYLRAPDIDTRDDIRKINAELPGGEPVDFSHWSFGQLCSLAGAPAAYLRTMPGAIAADALNWGLRHERDVDQVKTFSTQTDGMARPQLMAVTGPKYGRVPDYEVIEAVTQVAGNGTGDALWKVPGVINWADHTYDPFAPVTKESTTLYASDRDVFAFLVDDTHPIEIGKLDNGEPDLVFRGFYVKNSEVGSAAYVLAGFYLRGVCMNRCLWGVEGFTELKIRHSSGAPDRFMHEATPALIEYANGTGTAFKEAVDNAKAAKVAQDDEDAMDFLRKRHFNRSEVKKILETHEREEGRPARTAWDMVNGITAMARTIPHQDRRLKVEEVAGKLLDKVAA